jgi:hypothetical protein
MCPSSTCGNPGISTSHMCVERTVFPSGNFMLRGLGAIRTFCMGVSAITNTVVAPVSAIPCELGINGSVVCTLCAHTLLCDTFKVTTVLSSSSEGDPHIETGSRVIRLPCMEMGLARFHMHMGICLSPFPYGDHHMETGTCFIVLPIWKRGYPYGNGDLQAMCLSPFPYGDPHIETGSRFIRLPKWKQGSPYGIGYPHFHMVIPGQSKVLEYFTIFEARCCRR